MFQFAGFSAESLASRIIDGKARVLITADGFCRGPKLIKLKKLADDAIKLCRDQVLLFFLLSSIIFAFFRTSPSRLVLSSSTLNGSACRRTPSDLRYVNFRPFLTCLYE